MKCFLFLNGAVGRCGMGYLRMKHEVVSMQGISLGLYCITWSKIQCYRSMCHWSLTLFTFWHHVVLQAAVKIFLFLYKSVVAILIFQVLFAQGRSMKVIGGAIYITKCSTGTPCAFISSVGHRREFCYSVFLSLIMIVPV